MLIGLIIGTVSGILQFLMLAEFSAAVTSGKAGKSTVAFGLCQFFLPLAVLLVCALLFRDALLWAAIGMVAVLVGFAFIRFMRKKR